MAAPFAISQQMVPVQIAGNTTEQQSRRLQQVLGEAVQDACRTALGQLDRQSAQTVLDVENQLKVEVTKCVVGIVERRTVSDRYKDEEGRSDRVYPPTYRTRPIEAQVSELRKAFPSLKTCNERLGHKLLPEGAEAWFAIPRWDRLAPTYNEAVELLLGVLASKRKLSNRIVGKLGETYLRQSERSKLAEKILTEQQPGQDMDVLAAQAGMLHRGCSARRTRAVLAGNEFALGIFAIGCILLTHPERLCTGETLMIDCSGDEYSVRGDYTFDRVPLFDYDAAGIELSIFYEDRARNLWGTPTGFLCRPA